MPTYKAPVRDTLFLLNDVFNIAQYRDLPGFTEVDDALLADIFNGSAKFCETVMQPLNQKGDQQACKRLPDGSVEVPEGFKRAYEEFVEAGWVALAVDPQYGGHGLPHTLQALTNEYASSANLSLSMYPGLTMGALAALLVHGSEQQKQLFAPKMASGEWSGTMNLTEPHCGTDLGLLKTKAVPQADGSYRLTGQKIFISAGEHNLGKNIIHMVLARIEGAPAGTKGISLFIVPKIDVNEDGSLGARNSVSCGSIEHKMGINGNSTCVMNYDGARGFLIGQANKGLQAMFVMMNEARLGVAIQGLAMAEVAYQNAAAYAKERLQGRSLTGAKAPQGPADPIIVHPDVRRNLLWIRAFCEGARALFVNVVLEADLSHRSPDAKRRQQAEDRLGLLTPVLKSAFTDWGFEATVRAQQVFGGHGYIKEWGMEQFVRDARIAQIYEGANGIQALDLVGRKLPKDGGRALVAFLQEVGAFIKANADQPELKPFIAPLKTAFDQLQQAGMWFMSNAMANPDHAGAGATDYLNLFALVAMGHMWALVAQKAQQSLAKGEGDTDFLKTKLITARFFAENFLPAGATHLARITAGADCLMSMPTEMF